MDVWMDKEIQVGTLTNLLEVTQLYRSAAELELMCVHLQCVCFSICLCIYLHVILNFAAFFSSCLSLSDAQRSPLCVHP